MTGCRYPQVEDQDRPKTTSIKTRGYSQKILHERNSMVTSFLVELVDTERTLKLPVGNVLFTNMSNFKFKNANCADPPLLPRNGYQWKTWDADRIGIHFKSQKSEQDEWRKLLSEKIAKNGPGMQATSSRLVTMVKAFKALMDEIPYSPSTSSIRRLIKILNAYNNKTKAKPLKSNDNRADSGVAVAVSDVDVVVMANVSYDDVLFDDDDADSTDDDDDEPDAYDIEFVKAERAAVGDFCKEMRLKYSCVVDEMVEKTGIPKVALTNIFITQLVLFLGDFQMILRNWERRRPPLESAFQNLFRMFANIFMIPFRPGGAEGARSMKILGQHVVCRPDLRYQLNTDDITGVPAERDNVVVTIAEVKVSTFADRSGFGIGRRSKDEVKPTAGTTVAKASSSPPMKRLKTVPTEDEVGLSDDVKGRHAIELLMEIPFSTVRLKDSKEMKCALGLIIQSTKVRLTWLEITPQHFELIQKENFKELDNDMKAYVYYSQAYDMFVKEERRNLVEILMSIAAIGEKTATPFWQSLMQLLPKS